MRPGLHRLFRRRQAAWWTLVAGLAATAGLTWTLQREAMELDRKRLVQRALEIKTVLDARLERSEMLLHNLRDYLTLSGESRNQVFARWCYENGLTINCPWILGIAVATNRNEVDLREKLPNPPANWSAGEWEALYELARHHAIECELALHSNVTEDRQFLPDYDLRCGYSDRNSGLGATSQTRLAGSIFGSSLGMSHRQTVMLDTHRNPIVGTVFYVPIYRPALAEYVAVKDLWENGHQGARWMNLSAVIVAPVDFSRLIGRAEAGAADLGIEIFSSTNRLTAETWLNRDRPTPRADDPAFSGSLTHRQTWPMYRQRFTLFFYTKPLFEAQSPRRLVKTAGWAGLAITVLATALVGVSVRARNQQDLLTEQICEARDALAAAQREREKFSRDLHDGTIQSLYAIQLGLGHTVEKIEAAPAHARRELSAVRREMDTVIAEIRQFITAGVEAEASVDFCAVLHSLVQRARNGTTAQISLHSDPGASSRLSGDQAVQLANIAREALSNSLRHGKPQRVEITLRAEPETVVLEISDDGSGFNAGRPGVPARPASLPDAGSAGAPHGSNLADEKVRPPSPSETPPPTAASQRGVGLASMLARAQEMGGTFEIKSSPGAGTYVRVRVPAPPAEATEAESPDDLTDDS